MARGQRRALPRAHTLALLLLHARARGARSLAPVDTVYYTWAALDEETNILMLRPASNPALIECFYYAANASGVTMEVLGGGVVTAGAWQLQCANSSYASMFNISGSPSTPACVTVSGHDLSPRNATTVLLLAPPHASPAPDIPISSGASRAAAVSATLAFAAMVAAMAFGGA